MRASAVADSLYSCCSGIRQDIRCNHVLEQTNSPITVYRHPRASETRCICCVHVAAVTLARPLTIPQSAQNGKCKYIPADWSLWFLFHFPYRVNISDNVTADASLERDLTSEEAANY